MPVNPADRPVPAWAARRRGMRRLSAVTAGVGIAGVIATGAVALPLPGAGHNVSGVSAATDDGGTTSAPSHATSGSSSVATSSTSAANGAKSSVSPASGARTDATSGGS